MNKLSKKILVLALALAMCLTLATNAFAAWNGKTLEGTKDEPAQASINKTLQMPIGTITPKADFIFEIKGLTVDGTASTTMPVIGTAVGGASPTTGTVKISFDGEAGETSGDVKRVVKESANLFDIMATPFPAAGIYVYEITEKPGTNAAIDAGTNINETLAYSGGKYTMTVVVVNDPDTGDLYIGVIETRITTVDNAGQTVDTKVDPTPATERTDVIYEDAPNSEMVFTNTYIKQNGTVDPEDPNPLTRKTLTISKTVTGDLGNKTDAYFQFSVTIRNNSLVTTPTAYNAYIVENGAIVIAADIANPAKNNVTAGTDVDANGKTFITFTAGAAKNVSLKHGQSLVFVDTPVGTEYDVTEAASTGYVPSHVITSNNVVESKVTGTISTALEVEDKLVGEALNLAAFTNERGYSAPTGLSMNDLPFVGMILLAIGAFAASVVVKKTRKAKKANY